MISAIASVLLIASTIVCIFSPVSTLFATTLQFLLYSIYVMWFFIFKEEPDIDNKCIKRVIQYLFAADTYLAVTVSVPILKVSAQMLHSFITNNSQFFIDISESKFSGCSLVPFSVWMLFVLSGMQSSFYYLSSCTLFFNLQMLKISLQIFTQVGVFAV